MVHKHDILSTTSTMYLYTNQYRHQETFTSFVKYILEFEHASNSVSQYSRKLEVS